MDPGSRVPVLLLFARDELIERSWKLPGRYWPEHPRLVGGMDLREGGTWLAVDPGDGGDDGPAEPRVACLLNGFGTFAPKDRRITRGRIPLAAASGASISNLDLPRYDPFHLLIANRRGVSMLTWDGEVLHDRELGPGTHLVSNRGLEAEGDPLPTAPSRAVTLIEARIRHFRPLLQSAPRPEPEPGGGATRQAWGGWMRLADGDGLDPGDVRALIGRHDWGEGEAWMTSSVALLAVGSGGVRYDMNPAPGEGDWYEVVTA